MVGALLFTMRLVCCGVTFWCERHAHAMTTRWAALRVCICCKTCSQLCNAKAATSKTNVATHILTKLQLLPLCAEGSNVKGSSYVVMAALLLISTLFALLLASASIVYAFAWCLSYALFLSSANCSLLLPRKRQFVFCALLPTLEQQGLVTGHYSCACQA